MNTNPDDPRLAMWLDDELHGDDLAAFESRTDNLTELIAARAEVRRWRAVIASAVPATQEPPYPDFFNARVERAIRQPMAHPARQRKRWWFLRQAVLMPVAACAGMAFTFWLGHQSQPQSIEVVVEGAPRAIPVEPFVYVPETGVKAERFASAGAEATVIVLNGVAAIPDDTDFSKSTSQNENPESHSTADSEPASNDSMDL
jgi:hypothetical protein